MYSTEFHGLYFLNISPRQLTAFRVILSRSSINSLLTRFLGFSFCACQQFISQWISFYYPSTRENAAAAKSLQSCPTLCNPIDGSPPGSPVPGILKGRSLEGVAFSFSNAWKWKVNVKSLSRVQLLATAWTAAYQAPPSMGFSKQECWSGVPLPSPTRENSLLKNTNMIMATSRLKLFFKWFSV